MECKVRYGQEGNYRNEGKDEECNNDNKRQIEDDEYLANTLYNDGSEPVSLFRGTACLCITYYEPGQSLQ